MEMDNRTRASNETVERIKFRVRALILLSSVTLAVVFGASFYFALVSNSTAIARQIPELADVSEKMKGLLLINISIFTIVVIVSFHLLSKIITDRMFRDVDLVDETLNAIASNKLPERDAVEPGGTFEETRLALKNVITFLRDKELKELDNLKKFQREIQSTEQRVQGLTEIIEGKRKFLGLSKEIKEDKTKLQSASRKVD